MDKQVNLAYRIPGKADFKRKRFNTMTAAEKFVTNLLAQEGDDVEVRWQD